MWKNKFSVLLPKRRRESHKGDYGKVLIVAGSTGMSGAAILSSQGALRSGSGLTYLAVPKKLVDLIDLATPEVITLPFESIKKVKPNVIVAGPGLGVSAGSTSLVNKLFTAHSSPRSKHRGSQLAALVLDADALNIVAKNPVLLKTAEAKVIITPHPGEMARLIKKKIDYVGAHRRQIAREFAKAHKCIVVLKGHQTLVADPCGEIYVNSTGNPGMATGGVGDVLSGMIGSFVGQGISAFEAATLGVYLHGLAGDLAAREKGEYSLIASDLVEKIPDALRKTC